MSGPITVAGSYAFSTRLDGVRNLAASVKAATRARFPTLGPRGRPADERRRFLTPLDLMIYGFGPVVQLGTFSMSAPADEWALTEWYRTRRRPSFAAIPGPMRARRFASACGGPAQLAIGPLDHRHVHHRLG